MVWLEIAFSASMAVGLPNARVEKPKVVVDLGCRPDRGSRALADGALFDGDGGRKAPRWNRRRALPSVREIGARKRRAILRSGADLRRRSCRTRERIFPEPERPVMTTSFVPRDAYVEVGEIVFAGASDQDVCVSDETSPLTGIARPAPCQRNRRQWCRVGRPPRSSRSVGCRCAFGAPPSRSRTPPRSSSAEFLDTVEARPFRS